LERLLQENAKQIGDASTKQAETLREARRLSEEMIRRGEFNPV
jgi:hypothetical protein